MIPRLLRLPLALLQGVLHYPACPPHRVFYGGSLSLRSGHADGSGALARCYYSGRGVPKDDAIALSLASSSAESGSAYGQYVLGAIHFNGDCGLESNDQRAFFLWEQAAKQGHVSSADWLSVLCVTIYLMPCVMSKNSILASGTPKAGEFSGTF
jgi:TPR repeat protein